LILRLTDILFDKSGRVEHAILVDAELKGESKQYKRDEDWYNNPEQNVLDTGSGFRPVLDFVCGLGELESCVGEIDVGSVAGDDAFALELDFDFGRDVVDVSVGADFVGDYIVLNKIE
jgi:hypothetical protein